MRPSRRIIAFADLTQIKAPSARQRCLARCGLLFTAAPNMGFRIQASAAEEITEDEDTYQPVTCVMCQQVHLVNPFTGKVLVMTRWPPPNAPN